MTLDEVIAELRARADTKVVAGMHRVGINPRGTLGVQIPELQKLARRIGTDHALALDLWATGVHEARILAAMVDDPARLTEEQMDRWAQAFDSWDVCDQVCKYLFGRSPLAYAKAKEWAGHGGQFVKRASFALIADLAVNDKSASDEPFLEFLELAEREAGDDRNYVKKSVNWAIRQIGKRNKSLNLAALAGAKRIKAQGSPSARWIAADALRELSSAAVQGRLKEAKSEKVPTTAAPTTAVPTETAPTETATAETATAETTTAKTTARKSGSRAADHPKTAASEPAAAESEAAPKRAKKRGGKGAGSAQVGQPADGTTGSGAAPERAAEEPVAEPHAAETTSSAAQADTPEGGERPAPRRRRGSRGGRGRGGKTASDEPSAGENAGSADTKGQGKPVAKKAAEPAVDADVGPDSGSSSESADGSGAGAKTTGGTKRPRRRSTKAAAEPATGGETAAETSAGRGPSTEETAS